MTCKVIRIPYVGRGYEDRDLGDYELEYVYRNNPEAFVYSYGTGFYEGSGNALMFAGGKWRYFNLGHCSCNGPTESIDCSSDGYETLDALLEKTSQGLREEIAPIVEAARNLGITTPGPKKGE